MAFDSGNSSFRIFYYKEKAGEEIVNVFAAAIAPEIKTLSTSPISGWMSWRHLLDREITAENCYFQPWLHLTLMQAERKVPKPLLRAYCRLEEEAERKARNLEILPRKLKAEIKQRVIDSLTPEMPPTLTGISTVLNLSSNFVYSDGVKPSAVEAFAKAFKETTNRGLALITPESAALMLKQVNAQDLEPAVFSGDESVVKPEACNLGLEFLTWLWFAWETRSGGFTSHIGEKCEYMLEGPVTFFNEGRGAHNVVLSKGFPLQSREAGAAMLCGKKVSKVKFAVADAEKSWSATIDSSFAIRALKLPKDKQGGKPTFQERMELTDKFVTTFLHLYGLFLDERKDAKTWKKTVGQMRDWIARRASMEDGDITEH